MSKLKVLNAFCGIGGNRKGWEQWNNKIEVTAIDNNLEICKNYKENFPNDIVGNEDAYEHIKEYSEYYDIIWASPPCQTHSRYQKLQYAKKQKLIYPDLKLYSLILALQEFYPGKFVVENVISYHKPLIIPVKIGRHYFWSNIAIWEIKYYDSVFLINNISYNRYKEKYESKLGLKVNKIKLSEKNYDTVVRNIFSPKLSELIFAKIMEVIK